MINNYKVYVNGEKEVVYTTRVKNGALKSWDYMPFVIAESEADAHVEIYSEKEITDVCIRPKNLNIKCDYDKHTIKFTASCKAKLSVEINSDTLSAIGIFINNPVKKPENATKVIPEGIYQTDMIELNDNDVLYLEKGAYVKAKILLNGKNIRLCGNGLVSGENIFYGRHPRKLDFLIESECCSDCHISDVTLIQSSDWNMRINGCDRMEISDIKIIGYRGNNDGIDVCGSRDIEVHDCFIRTTDDCLTVKAFNTGDVKNLHFHDCVLWNNYANPMRVGGIRADKAENILFENMDIIHNLAGYPCFALLEGNRAHISNVTVQNIRVEDSRNSYLFDVRIRRNLWTTDKKTGSLKNIAFKNIYFNGEKTVRYLPQDSVVEGYSEECDIDGVTFENIFVYGRQMTSLEDCRIDVRRFAKNVRFIYEGEKRDIVKTYVEVKDMALKNDGYYYGSVVVTAENTGSKEISVLIRPEINPDYTHQYTGYEMREFVIPSNGAASEEYFVKLRPGKYLISTESDDSIVMPAREVIELDFVLDDVNKDTLILKAPYEICDTDGKVVSKISIGKNKDGLLIYAEFVNEMPETAVPELVVYASKKPVLKEGDALFSSIECVDGRAVPIIYTSTGIKTEPIMRCYGEIVWTLNNAPQYERIVCISCNTNGQSSKKTLKKVMVERSDGNSYTSVKPEFSSVKVECDACTGDNITKATFFIPFSELEFSLNDDIVMDFEVKPVLKKPDSDWNMRVITLFESEMPQDSVHMYANIR